MTDNYPFLDFMKGYDESVGLWCFSSNGCGGHTSAVVNLPRSHCGTISFVRLLIAAQTGKLEELNVTAILKGVKQTQISKGDNAGEFLWYLEENEIEDNHATFFNGLAMCALYGGHLKQFTKEQQSLIAEMLQASYPAFMRHVRHFNRYYSNEYLGDLVCAWLIGEWFGMPDDDRDTLFDEFIKIGQLWHKKGWGWGEHLSDTYSCICLDELSMILLFSKKLNSEAKESLYKLFCELLEIDDLFAGGPRVPAIRQYAFLSGPEGLHYRKLINPVPQNATFEHYVSAVGSRLPTCAVPITTVADGDYRDGVSKVWSPLGATFCQCGWREKLAIPEKRYSSGYYGIDCINGRAHVYIDANLRIGTSERFPFMPQAEHLRWGLAWQSFPVSIWTCDKEWVYMQWQTSEQGIKYFQPAEDKYVGRFNPSLTRAINPPVTGRTYSCVVGSDCFFVLRIMPSIVRDWQSLSDGFRIIGKSVTCKQISNSANWNQLKIVFAHEELYLQCVQLIAPIQMMQAEKVEKGDIKNVLDWRVSYSESELQHRRIIANLWVISRFKIESPPKVSLSYGEMDIKSDERMLADVFWHLPEQNLHIKINLTDLCSPIKINKNE